MCLKINWSVKRRDIGLVRELLSSSYGLLTTPPPPPPAATQVNNPSVSCLTRYLLFCCFQDPSKLVCRKVPLSHTVDLLRVVINVTPEESADYPLTSGLAESIKFLL